MTENYNNEGICKSCDAICYSLGCNNAATIRLSLPINDRMSCVIEVCESCISVFEKESKNVTAVTIAVEYKIRRCRNIMSYLPDPPDKDKDLSKSDNYRCFECNNPIYFTPKEAIGPSGNPTKAMPKKRKERRP